MGAPEIRASFAMLQYAVNENYLRRMAKIHALRERSGAFHGAKARAIRDLQETATASYGEAAATGAADAAR